MKVSVWYDDWIATYKKRKVKPITIETYSCIFKTHISPKIGEQELSRVTPTHIQNILNQLCDQGYSQQTISMAHIIMNSMFKQACKCALTDKNPCSCIELPKGKPQREITVFSKAQQDIFLDYCRKSPLCDLFLLALYTGMRGGEIFALRWCDVDLPGHHIYVRHTLHMGKGGVPILGTPKSSSSIRDIPLLPVAEKLLLKRMGEVSGTPLAETGFVFSTEGEPIRKGRVSYEIQNILKQMQADGISFPYFTLHTIRHSFATRCIEAGMKPKVLQQILGHSSLAVTMDIYVSIMDDEKIEQMKLLSNML